MDKHKRKIVSRQTITLLLSTALIYAANFRPVCSQTPPTEWLIEQDHVDLGQTKIYACHDAVKVVNLHWGYQILTKAPDWAVHCYRPETKAEWVGKLDQFSGSMLSNPVGVVSINDALVVSSGKGTLNGLKYTRFKPNYQSLSQIYGADDIAVAPQIPKLLHHYYNMPETGKVPLYYSQDKGKGLKVVPKKQSVWLNMDWGKDLRGGLVVELLTKSGKKIPYNSSDFDFPQGYTKQRLAEVGYSSKQKETIKDAIESFGFTSDSQTSSSNPANKTKAQPGRPK
jgi:hypothetical protein